MTPDDQSGTVLFQIRQLLQRTAMLGLGATALSLAGVTALAAAGVMPWLSLPAEFGGRALDAGPILQIAIALSFLMTLALLPGTARVMRLEAGHREFRMGIEDVTRAYWAAHAADRTGVFTLAREFDAVRERYEFLRQHPDLSDLDPELLELAAQMSTEARELALIYSDEKVAHAQSMLIERKTEAERLMRLIDRAHEVGRDMRRALNDVEMDEDVLRSRITVLREELDGLWPEIEAATPRPHPERKLRLAAE